MLPVVALAFVHAYVQATMSQQMMVVNYSAEVQLNNPRQSDLLPVFLQQSLRSFEVNATSYLTISSNVRKNSKRLFESWNLSRVTCENIVGDLLTSDFQD
jgi:hypothetical protein